MNPVASVTKMSARRTFLVLETSRPHLLFLFVRLEVEVASYRADGEGVGPTELELLLTMEIMMVIHGTRSLVAVYGLREEADEVR